MAQSQKSDPPPLKQSRIARFWLPLEATWLMMALEGPFLAALIARMGQPIINLAAYGVAFALAMILEAPIIMMLSAANALVRDRQSFQQLRRFSYSLNALITLAMAVLLIPPVFAGLVRDLIGLPAAVARLTWLATLILLPWPAAIGYRRFYQGLLIGNGLTRRVAYGTAVRISAMAVTALALYRFVHPPGALVGASALAVGVLAEAIASRLMAAALVRRLAARTAGKQTGRPGGGELLTMRAIIRFYAPLALTSLMALAVNPLLSFFLGKSRLPIESLAVLPVLNSLTFIFRSPGLSFQETSIALLGRHREQIRSLRRFAMMLGALTVSGYALLAITPLAWFWFQRLSGLTPELARLAVWSSRILPLYPGLEVFLAWQRSLLVKRHHTRPITAATAIEVTVIAVILAVTIHGMKMIGVIAAAAALLGGRLAANLFLVSVSPAGRREPWRKA